jgi:broad specificity phosphatase PhoE
VLADRLGRAMGEMTVVHLVRHGEVANPDGVLYGRLPGFHLSEEGVLMAKAAAAYLAGRDVTLLLSSPLERALETAAPIAAQFDLEVRVDERLIEPWNHFEGAKFDITQAALRQPGSLPRLANPFRPSWGEPYEDIAARMLSVMDDAAREAHGHQAVCVSHQLAIWVARRAAENRRLWHHPGRRQCALGSITSFTYRDGVITGVSYTEPAGGREPDVSGA